MAPAGRLRHCCDTKTHHVAEPSCLNHNREGPFEHRNFLSLHRCPRHLLNHISNANINTLRNCSCSGLTHITISITPESIVFADFQKIFWVFWNNSTNKIECAEFTNCSETMSSQHYVAHGQFRNRALHMDKTKHD